jgi:hypothetical protein
MQKIRLLKLRHILREDFDVIHYMLTPSKLNSFSFKTLIKPGKAKTIQTIATLREDLLKDNDYKDILIADLIITYSVLAKNKLNALGFNNVKRVYPGIDLDVYKRTPKDPEMQKIFKVSDDNFILQYVGGEYARMGAIDVLLPLITRFHDELRKRKIVLCLPGRMKDEKDFEKKAEVKKKISEAGAEDVVRYSDEIQAENDVRGQDWMSRVIISPMSLFFPCKI